MLSPMDDPQLPTAESDAPARIRVLLVDDHAVVRRGLLGFFELLDDIEVVGEAENGRQAVEQVEALVPDVVLMDLLMPVMDGIAATAEVKARFPEVEVVALTSFIEEERVTAALEAGATGYLLKDADADDVAIAVRRAHAGEVHLDPQVARLLANRIRTRRTDGPEHEPLTERETRGAGARGQGPLEQGDRLPPRHHRADGPHPRVQHPRQARSREPHAGGALGDRAPRGVTATATPPPPTAPAVDPVRPWTAVGPADAPAIVFLHGTRLSRSMWDAQLRALAARYRCIAVDLPGHGVLAGDPFTVAAATAIVRDAIDAESAAGRAVLVGLSLGGYVAVDTADSFPDRVAGLVLAGCSAEPVGAMAWPFRVLATTLERAPQGGLQAANRAFFRLRYRGRMADEVIEGGFWSAGGASALRTLVGRRYLDRLSRLWTPVLVVNGALDPVFGPQGDYWAASCRSGRHVVIRRAMHLSNLDRPAAFAAVVAGFTDRVTRGG